MKLLVVLLVVAVAVCAEARARGRRPSRRPSRSYGPRYYYEEEDNEVYRFHIAEDDYGAYIYHDEQGYAQGFEIDLMQEVCRYADKDCHFVMDKAEHCWYNEGGHEYPGVGLLAGWFDGCMGVFPTVERKNSFDFSHSFTKKMETTVWYSEAVLNEAQAHNLTNHRIGFVKGWASSPACLDHQSDEEWYGHHLNEYTVVSFDHMKDMVSALMHEEIEALVGPVAMNLESQGFTHTDPHFACTEGGASVMFRYGSDALTWWNRAFDEMVEDGDFAALCRRATRLHADHGELHCDLD